jgi:hypothetical protein
MENGMSHTTIILVPKMPLGLPVPVGSGLAADVASGSVMSNTSMLDRSLAKSRVNRSVNRSANRTNDAQMDLVGPNLGVVYERKVPIFVKVFWARRVRHPVPLKHPWVERLSVHKSQKFFLWNSHSGTSDSKCTQ